MLNQLYIQVRFSVQTPVKLGFDELARILYNLKGKKKGDMLNIIKINRLEVHSNKHNIM